MKGQALCVTLNFTEMIRASWAQPEPRSAHVAHTGPPGKEHLRFEPIASQAHLLVFSFHGIVKEALLRGIGAADYVENLRRNCWLTAGPLPPGRTCPAPACFGPFVACPDDPSAPSAYLPTGESGIWAFTAAWQFFMKADNEELLELEVEVLNHVQPAFNEAYSTLVHIQTVGWPDPFSEASYYLH